MLYGPPFCFEPPQDQKTLPLPITSRCLGLHRGPSFSAPLPHACRTITCHHFNKMAPSVMLWVWLLSTQEFDQEFPTCS